LKKFKKQISGKIEKRDEVYIKIWKQKDKNDDVKINNETKLLPRNILCIIQCRITPKCTKFSL